MNEFLDWLKEECLPGIWSKGVALSRNSKSIERISPSSDSNELKFKIQTTERMLAYQVTLWLKDQDAHCNCDSKIEPCHHIVGVALALQNGIIPESQSSPSKDGAQIEHFWSYAPAEKEKKAKITLKRRLFVKGQPQDFQGSLVSLIGGIQSGRVKLPLPSITPEDLKIDELFARGNPPWVEVLKAVENLPPLMMEGHPTLGSLKVNPKALRPVLRIMESGPEALLLTVEDVPAGEVLEGGLMMIAGTLGIGPPPFAARSRLLERKEFASFLREELPRLRETHEVQINTNRLPELVDGEPRLELKAEQVSTDWISLTARIEYPELPPGKILNRDLRLEGELLKEARAKYGLVLDQPQKLGIREAIALREALTGSVAESLNSFISGFLEKFGSLRVEDALKEKELLLKLLQKRERQPDQDSKISVILQNLAPGVQLKRTAEPHPAPESLWNQLRDYQKEGVRWLQEKKETLGGAILADDMGLGKTIQTLALIKPHSLVLLPTSLLQNWSEEAGRFRPDLKVQLYHGPNRKWDETADLTLSTYSILRLEAEHFARKEWDLIVLDEAHLIRNPETQAAIAVTRLNARFRIALTGTPIQNRRKDLLSLFQFVSPDLFVDESEMDPKLTSPFLLRRTKEQVLTELPPKTHVDHVISLTEEERNLYDSIQAAAQSELIERLKEDSELSPFTFFEVLLRARQVCNHRGLIDPAKRNLTSSKLTAILELIEELTLAGQSVLVYSQWTQFLNLLQSGLEGIAPVERLDGSTQNRGEVVSRFQNSNEATVFLLSLQAGGVGLNLTKASHVIFCDPWWNPFAELQAEDRAYRMGQENPVVIHRLLTKGTIEMGIRALQKEKLKLGQDLFQTPELMSLLKEPSQRS